jgi:two-component system, NarL family, sensor kinase
MTVVAGSRSGWAVAGISVGLLGLWVAIGGVGQAAQMRFGDFVSLVYANVVYGLTFPVIGALIISRIPGQRLGWLYCLCGCISSITLLTFSYAQRGLVDDPGSLPGALFVAWVSTWIWMCGFSLLLTFGVLWFPDGRLPSRRWRPVAAVAGLAVGLEAVTMAVRPGPLLDYPVRNNPVGLSLLPRWSDTVVSIGWAALLTLAALGSFAAAASRYRRGSAGERDQLRWLLVAVLLIAISIVTPGGDSSLGLITYLLAIVAIPLLPLSVGAAVLRHRLYGVELAVRRSLVYGGLLAAGLAVYAAVVLVLDAVLRGHAQPVVALTAAGAVAVLYQPLRVKLQRSADRMLYGDRGDPYAVLARLGRRLEAAGSLEQTLSQTVATIAEALRLPYVAIELLGDQPQRPTAAHGTRPVIEPLGRTLTHRGQVVGLLVVGPRDMRENLTTADHRLLDDLGRQVAVAAHAALLERELRRSRERLVLATEDERRRLRRDLHDGLGPALAGVALGVDAARNLLATAPRTADDLLVDLKDETLGCLGEVRRIIEDLRPPALDELGLVSALTGFADRLTARDGALRVAVQMPDLLPPLPAAVEVAVYRIATEAMTNVARHAHAHDCLLRLDIGSELTLEIRDDGVGVPTDPQLGVGLRSMTERAAEVGGRCAVTSADGGGTRVLVHLPLAAS